MCALFKTSLSFPFDLHFNIRQLFFCSHERKCDYFTLIRSSLPHTFMIRFAPNPHTLHVCLNPSIKENIERQNICFPSNWQPWIFVSFISTFFDYNHVRWKMLQRPQMSKSWIISNSYEGLYYVSNLFILMLIFLQICPDFKQT